MIKNMKTTSKGCVQLVTSLPFALLGQNGNSLCLRCLHVTAANSVVRKTWEFYSTPRIKKRYRIGEKLSPMEENIPEVKKPDQPYGIQGKAHLISQTGEIGSRLPMQVRLKKDLVYKWCMCGYSNHQPFCDGTHNSPEGGGPITNLLPLLYVPDRDMEVWLCCCKQTKDRPFCDGSHKNLPPPPHPADLVAPFADKKKK